MFMRRNALTKRNATVLALALFGAAAASAGPTPIPTGQIITATAAPGSVILPLNPGLADLPGFTAGQAVSTALSPDGKTLLVLTSGYNRTNGSVDGNSEYVFVFDVSAGSPVQKQVLQVANTYVGLAFAPGGQSFYVTGGPDDNVHVFEFASGVWSAGAAPIALGNGYGKGLNQPLPGVSGPTLPPQAAGVAVSADGSLLAIANYANDSLSIVTLATGAVATLDLRPQAINAATGMGSPGGEFPYWVAFKGNSTVYASSLRDREVDVVSLVGTPAVQHRIALKGNPNKMVLNRAQTRLFVTSDNSDTLDIIDTGSNSLVGSVDTTFPAGLLPQLVRRGSTPNSLALSPDESTVYVTNAGSNSVAVIGLNSTSTGGKVQGLIPTGWYPNSVSVSADGKWLYIANAKTNAGPNPRNCTSVSPTDTLAAGGCPASLQNGSANQYVWQLTGASLLAVPVPGPIARDALTAVVALNNGFVLPPTETEQEVIAGLRQNIKHIIYIVKENRTYDQILGDLPTGNGDATITQFPQVITPNFHALAQDFVLLDNFYCSGEVSMDGWQWSVGARTVDADDKATPVNYAGRGLSNDAEGTERGINVALPTNALRGGSPAAPTGLSAGELQPGVYPLPLVVASYFQQPLASLADPYSLPGTDSAFALDGPNGERGAGYIWDAALRAGKTVRNYGFFLDLTLENVPPQLGGISPALVSPATTPNAFGGIGIPVAVPANVSLAPFTDPYFRGFDNNFPDFYRVQEWQREFSNYAQAGNDLPQLTLLRVMHDHMGNFGTAIANINTPELQQADNDYAVGLIAQTVAHSRFSGNTLIFVLEDDAQDGPDHVDAHRSTGYIIGPYVKHGVTVSTRYSTVNMIRTIEDILGLQHLNLHDAGVRPMTDVFDLKQSSWTFNAQPSTYLYGTGIASLMPPLYAGATIPMSTHTAAWWAQQTKGMDFSDADRIDADAFNRILWKGLKGDKPYPVAGRKVSLTDD